MNKQQLLKIIQEYKKQNETFAERNTSTKEKMGKINIEKKTYVHLIKCLRKSNEKTSVKIQKMENEIIEKNETVKKYIEQENIFKKKISKMENNLNTNQNENVNNLENNDLILELRKEITSLNCRQQSIIRTEVRNQVF